jgi:hypothetical protein
MSPGGKLEEAIAENPSIGDAAPMNRRGRRQSTNAAELQRAAVGLFDRNSEDLADVMDRAFRDLAAGFAV